MSTATKAAHTPGPWTYSGESDGDFVIWGPGWNEFLANIDQEAFGPVPPLKIAFDINQANARLIAAAPEMLEALESAREVLRLGPASVLLQIEAAIQKAKGGQ